MALFEVLFIYLFVKGSMYGRHKGRPILNKNGSETEGSVSVLQQRYGYSLNHTRSQLKKISSKRMPSHSWMLFKEKLQGKGSA